MAFLEAILAAAGGGGGGTEIEEGDFTISTRNTVIPVQMQNYNAALCYFKGSSAAQAGNYVCHIEWKIPFDNGNKPMVTDGKATSTGMIGDMTANGDFAWERWGHIAPDGGMATGTWHYIAFKFTS